MELLNFNLEDLASLWTPVTLLVSILSGLLFGAIYDARFSASQIKVASYTRVVASTAFFAMLAIARSFESTQWERWLGVMLLFWLFIVGTATGTKVGRVLFNVLERKRRKRGLGKRNF